MTIAERVAASRAAQDLPPHVTDVSALRKVATLMQGPTPVEDDGIGVSVKRVAQTINKP